MAYRNSPKIVTDSLVLCLDAANTKSYPGTGTAWTDISNNGYNGTISGASLSAINSGSMYFNGSNNYVEFNAPIPTDSQFTLEFWYYPTRINVSYDMVYSGVDNTDLQLFFHSSSKALTTSIENVEYAADFTLTSNTINKWYHIVWTHDNITRKVYLNGAVIQSQSDTTKLTKNNTTARLGATTGNSLFLQGYIPMFKAYTRALTISEVLQNYNATKSRFGL